MQVGLSIARAEELLFLLSSSSSTSGNIDSIILWWGLLYGLFSQNKKDDISVPRIINLTKKMKKKKTHQMLLDEISQRR